MRKQLVTIVLVFAMSLSITACSNSTNAEGKNTTQSEQPNSEVVETQPTEQPEETEEPETELPEVEDFTYLYEEDPIAFQAENPDGYIHEVTIKYGPWIRATDHETLEKAWRSMDEVSVNNSPYPTTNDLFNNSGHPVEAKTAMMFIHVSVNNITGAEYSYTSENPGLLGIPIGVFQRSYSDWADKYMWDQVFDISELFVYADFGDGFKSIKDSYSNDAGLSLKMKSDSANIRVIVAVSDLFTPATADTVFENDYMVSFGWSPNDPAEIIHEAEAPLAPCKILAPLYDPSTH